MTVLADILDAELATVTREEDPPIAPFGYGADLVCADDLTPSMLEHSGNDPQVLAYALIRRLDCPRGALPDDPEYGIDLRAMCNRGMPASDVAALARKIRGELEKDDRVQSAIVTVTPSPDGSSIGVRVSVTPIDAAAGRFALTFAVTSAELVLEEISQ